MNKRADVGVMKKHKRVGVVHHPINAHTGYTSVRQACAFPVRALEYYLPQDRRQRFCARKAAT